MVFISIIIPIGISVYEFIIIGNDSVVFLADYPSAIGIIIVVYYLILVMLGILWIIKQLNSILNLRNETKKSELRHLQSQVNPHFFFNMLNNIYGMIDLDPNKAKKLILKLSDLMRYSIYEGEKNKVPLEEEIDFLKNYIDLHKMRYHKTVDVQFNIEIEKEVEIMPLLLIILLENAFKHGVENLRKDAYVYINLKVNHKKLTFEISNNFDKNALTKDPGIGIKNLKRRLDLVYPKKYTLSFDASTSIYTAYLELQL